MNVPHLTVVSAPYKTMTPINLILEADQSGLLSIDLQRLCAFTTSSAALPGEAGEGAFRLDSLLGKDCSERPEN